jgi:hypothetical protein
MRHTATAFILGSFLAMSAFILIARAGDGATAGDRPVQDADSPDERHGLLHPETCDQFAPPVLFRAGGRMVPGGMLPPHLPPPLMLAGLLSAIETGLGITSSQLDVWRDFSGAAMDFSLQSAQLPQNSGAEDQTLLDGVDSLAASAETTAMEASTLRATIQALKAELTPVQIQRLARLHSLRDHHIWSPRGEAAHPVPCSVARKD